MERRYRRAELVGAGGSALALALLLMLIDTLLAGE